jgi:hypothetical protein
MYAIVNSGIPFILADGALLGFLLLWALFCFGALFPSVSLLRCFTAELIIFHGQLSDPVHRFFNSSCRGDLSMP